MDQSKEKLALVADKHSLYRSGLTQFLKDEFGYSVVGDASCFDEAVTWLKLQPNTELALFGLSVLKPEGPSRLVAMRASHPNLKITVVSSSENKLDILASIAAGLNGFIPKSLNNFEFAKALRTVSDGEIYVPKLMLAIEPSVSRDTTNLWPKQSSEQQGSLAPTERLTPRQLEIFKLVQSGLTNKEISLKLGISIHTVKTHITVLLAAFDASKRIQLILKR